MHQLFDKCLDQPFDLSVLSIADVLISTMPAEIGILMIELATDRLELEAPSSFRQARALESVVQVIRHHLDQQKQIVTLFVALTVLAEVDFIDTEGLVDLCPWIQVAIIIDTIDKNL